MKKMLSLTLTVALVLSSIRIASADLVPSGTSVIVKLTETVSSKDRKKGDVIPFEVVADVLVNGRRAIAAGAPATGMVTNASKRFIAGIGGQLDIIVDKVQAVDGTWIPLEYKKGEHNGSSLVSLVLGYLCCCVLFLIPGKDVSIEKGTLFETKVVTPTATTPNVNK